MNEKSPHYMMARLEGHFVVFCLLAIAVAMRALSH
jgi:hypothetical protein